MRQATLNSPNGGTVVVTPNPLPVVGTVTNNAAAPIALTLLGSLVAIANAANPAWTEGRLVLLSVDLFGNCRVLPSGIYNSAAPAPAAGSPVPRQTDYVGSLFTKPIRRSQTAASKATITNSAVAVTIMPAQAAGIFADISLLIVTVTRAAGAVADIPFTLTLSDGTATYVFDCDTGDVGTAVIPGVPSQGVNAVFNPPLPATTAATIWTIATNVATVTVHAVAVAVLQKAS